ncbi:MAG: hypothetical protein NZ700_15480 [Gemmataceae bacterium]|nr:hypothetical protein [Gemmataceae bacterium]MDW8266089.1 hypothetical protein [Gemmataceae bacterium]
MEILNTLGQLLGLLLHLLAEVGQLALGWSLLIAWLAWWTWGVNWSKTWEVLAQGGWAPLTLIAVLGALVWSQLAPGECRCLGFVTILNFWWQLGAVALLVALTLFCGWLQDYFGWAPADVNLEPPLSEASHEHAHGH